MAPALGQLARAARAARAAPSLVPQRSLRDSISGKATWDGAKYAGYPQHVKHIGSLTKDQINKVIALALKMKADPHAYTSALKDRTLLALFEKPSLRTRVSLETGMTQLGGHCIYYALADSPLGKKESIFDTAKVVSRYVDVLTARVNTRQAVDELVANAHIPVVNALDDYGHPCQMLADLLTIVEHRPAGVEGMKLAFVGDCQNNMTYDLMRLGYVAGLAFVLVHVCLYVRTRTHVHRHRHMLLMRLGYVAGLAVVLVHVCLYVRTRTHVHRHRHIRIHIHVHVHMHIHVHLRIHTHGCGTCTSHACMLCRCVMGLDVVVAGASYTYKHTYMYAYIHTCTGV